MKRGFRIADAYVEIHADEEALRQGIRDLPGTMGGDADRAGQALGDKLTKGLAAKVEALSGRVANARLQEKKAADAVTLAEAKLNDARSRGSADSTKLLALEQNLTQAQDRLSLAHDRATKATKNHSEAEKLLGRAMEDVGKRAGKDAEKAGEDAGSKLAIGMRMSFIRNSPLIVAAVAGALIAGAPLMAAAAGLLFGGIGALVLKNNAQVRQSFGDLWEHVSTDTKAAAQGLVPVLTGIATSLGHSFDRIEPMLAQAFTASGPLLEKTVSGLERFAQNAMPGMLHAIQAGGPVFDGFANFLASTGSGLGKFFDLIAQHGPASGQVFTSLGSIIESLFRILGDLAGQGAELGGVVLPLVASALKVVADALHVIAPVLPIVVAGFAAFKIASAAAGWLDTFGVKLAAAGEKGIPFAGSLGKAATSASAFMGSLPLVGTALAALAIGFSQVSQQEDAWATAMIKGGAAADQARAQMDAQTGAAKQMNSGFIGVVAGILGYSNVLAGASKMGDKATESMQKQLAAMDPLTRAQTLQTQAQNDLADALGKFGPGSDEAAAAAGRYADKSAEVTRLQDQESIAIKGVTQAMVDQANQILAQTDASLALSKGTDELTKLASAAAAAVAKYGAGSNQASLAQDALTQGLQSQVHLLETYATSSVPKSLDAMTASQLAAFRMADGLNAMHAKYGDLGAAMEKERADLNAQVSLYDRNRVEAEALTSAFKDTGLAVAAIPGTKTVRITAPTAPAIAELKALGFTVTQVPGSKDVIVSADTDKAHGNLNALTGHLNQVGGMKPKPTLDVNPDPANTKTKQVMDNLSAFGGMHPDPTADINPAPARNQYNVMMGMLGTINGQRPNPTAYLSWSTWAAENAINYTARPRTAVIYVETVSGYHVSGGNGPGGTTLRAEGGPVGRTASVIRAASGRVVGPGTSTSDSIPAVGPGGTPWALSDDEWVINARASRAQGDERMSLLNQGRATIVPTVRPSAPTASGSPMSSPNPTSGSAPTRGDSGGTTITVQNLTVAVQGVLDFSDPNAAMKVAVPIRDAIIKLERQAH